MDSKQVVETFWQVMEGNDFYAAARLLHEEYILDWPQSGERVRGAENFAKLNTSYPAQGKWRFVVNSIVADGETVVTDVSVTDGVVQDRVIAFSIIRDEKIWKQVEFWPEPFEAPNWRAQWVERF